ncbi:MAG: D-alanine--D-alanine ligase family protein [Lentisphaeria bacterium]|jgi:D-alanine-D-alanine ligase
MPSDFPYQVLIISNAPGEHSDGIEVISEQAVADEVAAVQAALTEMGLSASHRTLRNAADAADLIVFQPDTIIFNLCEGLNGDSAFEMHLAALLELSGTPFTGNNALTLGLARNKVLAKQLFTAAGISTPRWAACHDVPSAVPGGLSFPLIVKPACEDASLGIFKDAVARDLAALRRNVQTLLEKYPGSPALVEEFIDGREFNVALLPDGNIVITLPPSELDFSAVPAGQDHITSYEAKWLEDHPLYQATPSRCPADITPQLRQRLQDCARAVFHCLNANAYGRVDFRVDSQERLFVLEFNPNPDITPGAGFSKALQAADLSYRDFVSKALREALSRARSNSR